VSARRDSLLFRAFADDRRLRILRLLSQEEMCVGDLIQVLRLPQSTVSRQLGILRTAGLVACREEGPWRHYHLLAPDGLLHERLIACLGQCFEHVPQFARDQARARGLQRAGGCCPAPGR
jgi:ArsR family transcriptional regulator